jgi:choline kinase
LKAIIIAAGMGKRLEHMTTDIPKCLVAVNGKSMLQHQIDAYRANGIHDIHVIKGYMQEKIDLPGLTYYLNEEYETNSVLLSLMHAEMAMDEAFIATYSDIIFGRDIVARLMESDADISVIVDTGWKGHYEGRTDHPIEEAEKTIYDEQGHVVEIGKIIDHPDQSQGEYIGMFKCSKAGAASLRAYYHQVALEFSDKPFVRAETFRKAFVTDLLQYMIGHGVNIQCVCIDGGWHEIDTLQDISRVNRT